MSSEEYRRLQEKFGRDQMRQEGKHKNQPMVSGGEKFASKRENARWVELQLLERAGKITDLQRQVVFVLIPAVMLDGRKKPPIRYVADAVYTEDGAKVVEDAKSPHLRLNAVYRMKKHLMKHVHNLDIREV